MRISNRWLLVGCVVLSFGLRFAYAAATGALWRPQTWEMEQVATNLIEGKGFLYVAHGLAYRSYCEPMYPFLAAAVYLLTGHSFVVLVLVQLIIASATVWIAGRAATVAADDSTTGGVTALILAVHPGLIRYSSILHPFVLDCFFFTAAGAALLRYRQKPTLGRGCAAAALVGLGALTRPTILVFLLVAFWIDFRTRRIAVVMATALAFVAPWTIRNAVVYHQFMLTRSGSGYVFWLGNNPASTGSAADAAGRPLWQSAPAEFQRRINAADEPARDRLFLDDARRYIRAHPAAAVVRIGRRMAYFWWFSPQWGAAYAPRMRFVYRLWWGGLLMLIGVGLIGLTRAARARRRDLLLLASLALLVSAAQSLYYVEGRHRLAVEPLIVPLAAAGIMVIVGRGPSPLTGHPRRISNHAAHVSP
jgi:hypothetical protein